MTEEDVPNTTFLKWVVAILGILIVGVAVVLIVTMYKRMANTSENANVPTPAVVSEAVSTTNFETLVLSEQKELQVLDIKQSNDNLLVIYGDGDRTPRKIIVLNPNTGKIVGQIILK